MRPVAPWQIAPWLILAASGCGAYFHTPEPDAGGDAAPDADTDTDSDTDTVTGTETHSETDTPTPCDPISGEGCEPFEKCGVRYPVGDDLADTACVSEGSHGAGERCTIGAHAGYVGAYDNCTRGLVCSDIDSDGLRECVAACPCDGGDCLHTACVATEVCFRLTSEDTQPDFAVGLCWPTTPCEPLAQIGCDAGQGCYLIGPEERRLTDCGYFRPADDSAGTQSEPCDRFNGCVEGYWCAPSSDGSDWCRRLCDLEGGAPVCASGEGMCEPVPGHGSIGACGG